MFLLDSSSVVTPESYSHMKSIVKKLAKHLNIAPRQSRAAVIVFGSNAATTVRFNSYNKLNGFEQALDTSPAADGTRRIDKALEMANQVLKSGRRNFPRAVVLFTTGRQARESGAKSLSEAARELLNGGVKLFVIMVHNSRNPDIRDFTSLVKRRRDIITETSFKRLEPKIRSIAKRVSSRSSKSS